MSESEKKSHISQEQREWMLTQSYTRLMHRQYKDCLILLRGLCALCPEDAEVYSMMSYACLEAGDPEECLSMVDKYMQYAAPEKQNIKEIQWIRERAQLRINKKTQSDKKGESAE
ncbi:MAG: hypothetical protein OXD32_00460 [Endozoicomonadaceae bacterium]|nr:hypothetical protein [Endozoicomonadaceae bacterium]MCY4329112.1 hypothetical protein [Endozoicomonadaceae bacterium]